MNNEADLQKLITNLKEFTNKNGLILLKGTLESDPDTVFRCQYPEISLTSFLESGMKSHVNTYVFDTIKLSLEHIKNQQEFSALEPSNEIKNLFRKIKTFDKEIYSLSIWFATPSAVYEFSAFSENVVKQLQELDDLLQESIDSSKRQNKNSFSGKDLSEELKMKLAIQIAERDDFYPNQYRNKRLRSFASEILKKNGIDESELKFYVLNNLTSRAQRYFSNNLKANKDKEYKKLINKMKAEGMTKKAIMGKLDLTETLMNRLYY